jgi:hypothetical protein
MIPASELRIGNYLNIHGDPAPIQIGWFYLIAKGDELPPHEPIPLTPEILEKAGFVYDKITHYKNILMLAEGDNGFDVWVKHFGEGNRINAVKHLHQLQNLYFALTGEELNIEL